MDNGTIIIKGRFKALATSSYGLFIVFIDNGTKNVEKFDIVSSHFSTLYENNIGMPWSEMEEIIAKLKWKGEYATSLTHDIQASIEDLFQPGTGRIQDIWANIKKAQLGKVGAIFDEIMARPSGDKGVKSEIAIESVMRSDIEDARRLRRERENMEMFNSPQPQLQQPQENAAGASSQFDASAVVLEVALVLSPLSGIPIYDLKEGDKIMVKISEQSSRGQYFIDLLNASNENEIIPIPATVVSVVKEGKIFTVMATIGPSIFGKSIDEDTVKVKKYDPAMDAKKKVKAAAAAAALSTSTTSSTAATMTSMSSSRKKNGGFPVIFLIIGGSAVLMVIIMIYLFMS